MHTKRHFEAVNYITISLNTVNVQYIRKLTFTGTYKAWFTWERNVPQEMELQ